MSQHNPKVLSVGLSSSDLEYAIEAATSEVDCMLPGRHPSTPRALLRHWKSRREWYSARACGARQLSEVERRECADVLSVCDRAASTLERLLNARRAVA